MRRGSLRSRECTASVDGRSHRRQHVDVGVRGGIPRGGEAGGGIDRADVGALLPSDLGEETTRVHDPAADRDRVDRLVGVRAPLHDGTAGVELGQVGVPNLAPDAIEQTAHVERRPGNSHCAHDVAGSRIPGGGNAAGIDRRESHAGLTAYPREIATDVDRRPEDRQGVHAACGRLPVRQRAVGVERGEASAMLQADAGELPGGVDRASAHRQRLDILVGPRELRQRAGGVELRQVTDAAEVAADVDRAPHDRDRFQRGVRGCLRCPRRRGTRRIERRRPETRFPADAREGSDDIDQSAGRDDGGGDAVRTGIPRGREPIRVNRRRVHPASSRRCS